MSGFIATPSMRDIERLQQHLESLEERVAKLEAAASSKELEPVKRTTRGTRVPEDYVPPDHKVEQMMAELRCSKGELVREHRKFMDYFLSAPGQKGVKTNWDRAWCNWMRGASERGLLRSNNSRPNDDKIRDLMEMKIEGE